MNHNTARTLALAALVLFAIANAACDGVSHVSSAPAFNASYRVITDTDALNCPAPTGEKITDPVNGGECTSSSSSTLSQGTTVTIHDNDYRPVDQMFNGTRYYRLADNTWVDASDLEEIKSESE